MCFIPDSMVAVVASLKQMLGLNVKEVEAFIAPSPTNGQALPDRDRILNDVVNTGVSATLVGGFALGNLQEADDVDGDWMSLAIYMLSCAAHPAHEPAHRTKVPAHHAPACAPQSCPCTRALARASRAP